MLSRLPFDLPTSPPAILTRARPAGAAQRILQLEEQVTALAEENRRLMEAIAAWYERINVEGALEIADASIRVARGLQFPATQVASTDVNNLDDYEEGHATNSWTPVGTFATPGDLAIGYAAQIGTYTKIGDRVLVDFQLVTSSFTHTTAAGNLRITGLPFTVKNLDSGWIGALWWQGITKANYTNVVCNPRPNTTYIEFYASGSGVGGAAVTAADMPTGGSLILKGQALFVI